LHLITEVTQDSPAAIAGVKPGGCLISVNGQKIADVLDYQFECSDSYITIDIEMTDKSIKRFHIKKKYAQDPGLVFADAFMSPYHSCNNKCIFCFIDQNPPGMRPTIYFKDDDARLSFLHGNYVTLTNFRQDEIERIIARKMYPVNISFHTTNKKLRCKMLNNRFAGDSLRYARRLYEAGIEMNGQIVLCRGINDGCELIRTIKDLSSYIPVLKSLSIVPAGLTKYRDGLYPLENFTPKEALRLDEVIKKMQMIFYKRYGCHFVHLSDEWYFLARKARGKQIWSSLLRFPKAFTYDSYPQLENGVGMITSFRDEILQSLQNMRYDGKKRFISIATGSLAYGFMKEMERYLTVSAQLSGIVSILPKSSFVSSAIMDVCSVCSAFRKNPKSPLKLRIHKILNRFYGGNVTVSGLLTGSCFKSALKGKNLGEKLLIPANALKAEQAIFLDDCSMEELSAALQVRIVPVKSCGVEFLRELGFK